MEDLFNLNADDFTGKPIKSWKVDENLFNPSPDQGQNGVYKAIIRFIPWAQDPKHSKYKKYSATLTNPLTNERLYIDCPSTTGAPSILWSLDTELKELKETEPTVYAEIKEYFNRFYNYYSPIYIKRDPQTPQVEGKIKIYAFGYGIDNLIQQELNPESELVTVKKINPYSLLEGKDFVLVVKRKTKKYREYTSSKFMPEVSPLIITHNGKEIPASTDPKVSNFISKFLLENTPDMSQYFLKPWTEEEYVKVAQFIKAIVPYKNIIDKLVAGLRDEKLKSLFTSTKTIRRDIAPDGESLEFGSTVDSKQTISDPLVDIDESINARSGKSNKTKSDLLTIESDSIEDDDLLVKEQLTTSSKLPGKSQTTKSELDDLFKGL